MKGQGHCLVTELNRAESRRHELGETTPTIAKFEQKHTILLTSYIALAKALGYSKAIKDLLSELLYHTIEELEMINKNKNRKKGRYRIGK